MKIKSLQISNILSFGHAEDISIAPAITFDKDFNILIGQNGAGKSTVLEVINFIFRRVLFVPYQRNRDLYSQRSSIDSNQRRTILARMNDVQYYRGFRLNRNYDFENQPQKIRIVVEVDDIDRANIQSLQDNREKILSITGLYSAEQIFTQTAHKDQYQIDINLDSTNQTFATQTQEDFGFSYLTGYNLFKEAIAIYNEENNDDPISDLDESFALIGSYRNYNSYVAHVSVGGGNTAQKQIQQIKQSEYSKSANATESSEPAIFSMVRLRMAERCFDLFSTKMDQTECEQAANNLDFVISINEKLAIVNLKVEVKLTDKSSWNFAFSFLDTKRNRQITDINSLSAGQKAITHLVFEAYGRGHLKGGLVIIDEPEIHLHYQFQDEYLRVIEKLNEEQGCQYILVTHSESLINSQTINSVIRLSLDQKGYTQINQPRITTAQKWLVKILDNTRSTHAFFGSKILIVEGEDDRYFFRSLLGYVEQNIKKGIAQDVTVLDITGKGHIDVWKGLFGSFGLRTYVIADLDKAYKFYPGESEQKIHAESDVTKFLTDHPDVISKIEAEYSNGLFILKQGNLELYLGIHNKGLDSVIKFCHNDLSTYLSNSANSKVSELKKIVQEVVEETNLW